MISCSVKPSPCRLSGLGLGLGLGLGRPRLPPLSAISVKSCHLSIKTLRLSSAKGFLSHAKQPNPLFQCSARRRRRRRREPENTPTGVEEPAAGGTTILFLHAIVLSLLNSSLTVDTKNLFNVFPYPWLTSAVFLAAGSIIMGVSWLIKISEPPKTDRQFWLSLAPVAVAHVVGVVAAAVSLSKLPTYYAQVLACGLPAFRICLSEFLFGPQLVHVDVCRSIILITSGIIIAIPGDNGFNITGFMAAVVSNLAFALKDIIYERTPKRMHMVTGANYYACLSMMSLLFLAPFAIAIEGPRMLAAGTWELMKVHELIYYLGVPSVFYHWYNMEAYKHFPNIHPFQFIKGNAINKAFVIVSSIIHFSTPVHENNLFGAMVAIHGSYVCYEGCWKFSRIKSWFL